tara:strand:- start:323 stop:577 length:255 start_codon:yes stop_codon:yes gene_type:complete
MNKEEYKEQIGKLITENSELKNRVEELETELYFVSRNNKIDRVVDEKQTNLFDDNKQMNIFESPDGGKTIYKRLVGSDKRTRIK